MLCLSVRPHPQWKAQPELLSFGWNSPPAKQRQPPPSQETLVGFSSMLISPLKRGESLFDVALRPTESRYFANINIPRGNRGLIGIRPKVSRGRHSGVRCLILKEPQGDLCF